MAKRKDDPQTLYMNTETYLVTLECGDYYESFVPSRKWNVGDQGWIVYVTYTTYDSFDLYDTIRYEIIDAYDSEDIAHEVAQAIQKYEQNINTYITRDKTELDIPLGNGVDRLNSLSVVTGWGYLPKSVCVQEFTLNEKPKRQNTYNF